MTEKKVSEMHHTAVPSSLTSTMTLSELLADYTASVACSDRYVQSLRRTVRKAESIGIKTTCQLVPERVNEFLSRLTLHPTTRHNIRRELLTLWRYAFDRHLTEVYPARIRKCRAEYAQPQAWTPGQLVQMLEVARGDRTPISNRVTLRRCDVLPVWILINYETGLRFSDILALKRDCFVHRCLVVREAKTRKTSTRPLTVATYRAATTLLEHSPDGTLFRWLMCRRRAFYIWRKFLDQHGFGGSTRWFRRSAATQVHIKKRGAAQEFLMHSDPRLAIVHYVDRAQLLEDQITPPPIGKTPAVSIRRRRPR